MASSRRSSRPIRCSEVEPLRRARLLVDAAELALADVAVVALELLLGAQLLAVVGQLAAAPLAVLAGARLALVEGALRPAPDVLAEAAVDLVLGADALGHVEHSKVAEGRALQVWSTPSSARSAVLQADRHPSTRRTPQVCANAGHWPAPGVIVESRAASMRSRRPAGQAISSSVPEYRLRARRRRSGVLGGRNGRGFA